MSNRNTRVGQSNAMGEWSNRMGNGVSKDRCMSNQRPVSNQRSVSNHGVSNCLRVGRGALIAHFRDEAIIVVGMVVDSLDTSVREIDRVGTLHNTVTIIGLLLVEGSTRVVISNSIVVVVGGDLSQVRGTIGGGRVAIDRSMGNSNRVSNSRGSMDHWAVSNQGG